MRKDWWVLPIVLHLKLLLRVLMKLTQIKVLTLLTYKGVRSAILKAEKTSVIKFCNVYYNHDQHNRITMAAKSTFGGIYVYVHVF